MKKLNKLKKDLRDLGVEKGDTLLIRADLSAIGVIETKRKEDYLDFILDVVGEEGTIVGLSFIRGFFIINNKTRVSCKETRAYTGAFANIMLKHPKSIRSSHPTNSFVAIGKNASYITCNHNENSGGFEPIRKIIELKGKMILIGCVNSSPGFTTTHLAEVDLGLHKRIILPSLNRVFYKKNNIIKLFKAKEIGGCSTAYYKLYSHYVKNELLIQGFIGNAYSVLIDATKAYKIDFKILRENPRIAICDDPACFLCRTRRWDNLKDAPRFFFTQLIPRLLKKMFKKFR